MNKTIATIQDFYETILPEIESVEMFLPMLVADNEEDKKIMQMTLDMLKTLKTDIKEATSISELMDTLNIDLLVDTWHREKVYIMDNSYRSVRMQKEEILKEFGYEDDI